MVVSVTLDVRPSRKILALTQEERGAGNCGGPVVPSADIMLATIELESACHGHRHKTYPETIGWRVVRGHYIRSKSTLLRGDNVLVPWGSRSSNAPTYRIEERGSGRLAIPERSNSQGKRSGRGITHGTMSRRIKFIFSAEMRGRSYWSGEAIYDP